MPSGNYLIDPASFTSIVLMSSMPREAFGKPGEQERNAAGTPKWSLECAVSFPPPAPGIKASSEVITITITSDRDPAEGMSYPAPAQFTGLRMGVSAPERRGDRIVGGKPYFMADGVRAVGAAPGLRPVNRDGEQKAS